MSFIFSVSILCLEAGHKHVVCLFPLTQESRSWPTAEDDNHTDIYNTCLKFRRIRKIVLINMRKKTQVSDYERHGQVLKQGLGQRQRKWVGQRQGLGPKDRD